MTEEAVLKYVNKNDLLFVLSNEKDDKSDSSDVDIYCVTLRGSSVHLFYDNDQQWVELFIDNINDLKTKIENVDEIAINFVRELKFVSGDKDLHQAILENTHAVIENYTLPEGRKNILKYRIKVLLSKYLNPGTSTSKLQQDFILSSMTYPLVQLILAEHNIFPSSPKKWVGQLEEKLPKEDFSVVRLFINHQCSREDVVRLCDTYAGALTEIHIDKSTNNNLTFIS